VNNAHWGKRAKKSEKETVSRCSSGRWRKKGRSCGGKGGAGSRLSSGLTTTRTGLNFSIQTKPTLKKGRKRTSNIARGARLKPGYQAATPAFVLTSTGVKKKEATQKTSSRSEKIGIGEGTGEDGDDGKEVFA